MTKRHKKRKMANTGTNSTPNGKQTPWFTIGGDKNGSPKVPEIVVGSSWNPGKCYPRTKFKDNRIQ